MNTPTVPRWFLYATDRDRNYMVLDPDGGWVDYEDHLDLEARAHELQEALLNTAAHLAATIHHLERGGKATKKTAPSDKMFDKMLRDYKTALKHARAVLTAVGPPKGPCCGGDYDES